MTSSRKGAGRPLAGICAAVLAMLLATTPWSATAVVQENPGQGAEHRAARAEAALAEALKLFASTPATPGGRRRATAPGRHASIVLRDLALGVPDLDSAEQKVARRILARPTADAEQSVLAAANGADVSWQNTCEFPELEPQDVCVHWVTDPVHPSAPSSGDFGGVIGVPDWVETNREVLTGVWQKIVGEMRYRQPPG